MLSWSIEKVNLELKYTWKISRNASDQKTNLVNVKDESYSGSGEAAPNVRYQESADESIRQFNSFLLHEPGEINSYAGLENCLNGITCSNALRFAIESAFVHYLAAKENRKVFDLLKLESPAPVQTSYSIPIMETGLVKTFYEQNRLSRFRFIKIKVDAESGTDAILYLSRFCSQPLIVDANEAFSDVDACIYFLEKIKKKNIEFIEQPMPSTMHDESEYLKKYSPFRLFADESITAQADFSGIRKRFDGVNIKMMKTGGYRNGIHLLREAKKNDLQTMIGCMVETTLGISSALNLCSLADYVDLDSFLLVRNEPYKLVSEADGWLTMK